MTGTTTNGYPYVTPTDHPVEFPAHSQALANKLETVTVGTTAQAVFGSGWAGAAEVAKFGKVVTFAFNTAKASFAAGETVCTIPAGYLPATYGSGNLYLTAVMGSGTAAMYIVVATGLVKAVAAGTVGLLGSATWRTP